MNDKEIVKWSMETSDILNRHTSALRNCLIIIDQLTQKMMAFDARLAILESGSAKKEKE